MSYIGTITDAQFHPMEDPVASYILFSVLIPNVGNETVRYENSLNKLMEKFGISTEDGYEYNIPTFVGLKCEVQPAKDFYQFVRFMD